MFGFDERRLVVVLLEDHAQVLVECFNLLHQQMDQVLDRLDPLDFWAVGADLVEERILAVSTRALDLVHLAQQG